MSKNEIYDLIEELDGKWSTEAGDLRADIKEFASEHGADCEFWFENEGSLVFTDDDEEDVEILFEIVKSGACTYIINLK